MAPEDYEELEAVVEEEEAPAATVHQNTDTGVVDLDIDVSVLGQPRPPPLVTKLLGANWQVRLWLQLWGACPRVSVFMRF